MPFSFIRHSRTELLTGLVALLCLAGEGPARAGENELAFALASQRAPDDFDKSVSTVTKVAYSHTFDNNAILAASVTYFDVSYRDAWHLNSQIGLGYKYELSDVFSVVGVASIGSRMQSDDVNFPYYALHASLDWRLLPSVTWSVLNLRYRNAFNTSYDFDTPGVGSSVAFRLDETKSVSFSFLREWDDGEVVDNEFGIGFAVHF